MPTGIFLINWDEVIGGVVYMRYPESLEIPDPMVQQITISHNFTESYIITKEKQWNSVSYYNENKEMIIVLILGIYDDGKDYLELLEEFNRELDEDIKEDILKTRLETMFRSSLEAFRTTDEVISKLSKDVAFLRTKEYDIEERFKKVQNSDHLSVKSKILFLLAVNDGLSLEEIKNSVNTSNKWLETVLETLVKNEVVGYNSNRDIYYIRI
ncbi:MAG: hypothetical protein ACFFFT_01245 [Candidatus Thorarchaeota archaeon]